MSDFIGIDLGTTNSAICSYDGAAPRILKSREQNDVTPSVIYFDSRMGKRVGHSAYDMEPVYHENCASLFKRRMGEDTRIELPAIGKTLTPEECSAEILKELFSYLPEEISKSSEIGTVVTVPAAFNQMKRNATRQAAEMAGIGKVELMQEPVAAVMSYMQSTSNTDGTFLIYDLGGGTFDVAIAESIGGRVNLLGQDGIEACGGRDFDRLIVDNIVLPLLHEDEEYDLPVNVSKDKTFEKFLRIVTRSAEIAKIGLSHQEEATITIPHRADWFHHLQDLKGDDIFKEIPFQRNTLDKLIVEKINDTINCARKTMEECGMNARDLDRIVWVGGPTHYKPLRDKVASELNINGDISNLNPMTAVAEGASLFAESIDWSSDEYKMKPTRGRISADELALSFNYTARTPSDSSKIAVQVSGQVLTGTEFQVESLDTGWISGRMPLKHAVTVDVDLTKIGENTFRITVYDAVGESIKEDEIIITKTTAIVETIPASHSIAVEVLDRSGGRPTLVYLVRKNDPLPQEGVIELKANEKLVAGSSHSLEFNLREGEFVESINANEHIGVFKIEGTDLDYGVISEGADLICNYEIMSSDEIRLKVEVPEIGGIFEEVYSREEGQSDYTTKAREVIEKAKAVHKFIEDTQEIVDDPKLDQAKRKLEPAHVLDSDESDPEKVKEVEQGITQAQEMLEEVIRKNRKEIRQSELDRELTFFDTYCRQHAKSSEVQAFDSLAETAQRSIDNNDSDFDEHLNEFRGRMYEILWRQPWFVIEQFKQLISTPYVFNDREHFEELATRGKQLLESQLIRRYEELPPAEKYQFAFIDDGTIEKLREVVRQIMFIPRVGGDDITVRNAAVNVFKT